MKGDMTMPANMLTEILSILRSHLDQIIGADLVEMILYGSFARGDFDEESDIDIAVIVNIDRAELKKYQKDIVSVISEMSLDYDTLISINYISLSDFEEYKSVLPYYKNIDREGVRVVT